MNDITPDDLEQVAAAIYEKDAQMDNNRLGDHRDIVPWEDVSDAWAYKPKYRALAAVALEQIARLVDRKAEDLTGTTLGHDATTKSSDSPPTCVIAPDPL